MTAAERERLRALVDQAWELRGSPYLRDACEAIIDWHDRRALARLELQQVKSAAALALLRRINRELAALDTRQAA